VSDPGHAAAKPVGPKRPKSLRRLLRPS
jgi:hypothetical protein